MGNFNVILRPSHNVLSSPYMDTCVCLSDACPLVVCV